MIELIIYFAFLIVFFAITFKVMRGLNVEGLFKKNHIWEIQAFYIIISLVIAHVLSTILLRFYEWAILIMN